jgi:hypothetical protein
MQEVIVRKNISPVVSVFIAAIITYYIFAVRYGANEARKEQISEQDQQKAAGQKSTARLHFFGVDPHRDPATGRRVKRGIFASDRVHTLVVGRTGYGKTRLLLSLIKQHIENDEGFMLIDAHRDLAPLVLSHIPPEKAGHVIYINPMTAFDRKRVVQINFLECKDPDYRDVTARLFMDSLEKIYERWWGPRLDMILLNALYLLMEKEGATLPQLYSVLTDEMFRERFLQTCRDERVKNFWQQQYKRMPSDASTAVLTKIYKIVQERVIVPIFEAERSSVDFRQAMDSGKFIIVDLPEGSITTDLANFIGSLILARLYLAGMSREDTPESQRRPFYVYVDEAYRFTTKSIADILQSLRKYRVYMTLASQFLEQYIKTVQLALPECCDTVVCFTVGEKTARALEHLYPPEFGFEALMNLPQRHFFISTTFRGSRECAILQTMEVGQGPYKEDEIINVSLLLHGRDIEKLSEEKQMKSNDRRLLSVKGTIARDVGINVQLQISDEIRKNMESKGYRVVPSTERGHPDIVVIDHHGRVVEVTAVKTYSLDITTGRGCRNIKGKKYAASFCPKKDAKAEYQCALKNGLDKIKLIAINLKTGNKIFEGHVSLEDTITLREFPENS